MKIELIGSPETVMSNPHSRHAYFGWPTAVKLQNGVIAVGASGFKLDHVCPFGKAVISFSRDGGKTYTFPAPVIDTPLDDRDVGICTFGESGVILTSFNNSAEMQRGYNQDNAYVQSYIDTITKEDEEKFLGPTFRISRDCGITFGEIMRSPVTSPHGPTQLRDGTVLWAGNNFNNYRGGVEIVRVDTESGKTEFIGRITLEHPEFIIAEPHLIEMPDGSLICHCRGESEERPDDVFTLFQSVSHDRGKTWSEPEMILDVDGGAPSHMILLDSGLLLATYSRRKRPYGIMAMFSRDGGESWEKDIRLYEGKDSDDLGYPSTVILENGELLTVFYATESDDYPCTILQQRWRISE